MATTPQTEQFVGGLQRTTFTVTFNNRGDTVRVVTEGHLARPTLTPVNPATAPATQKAAKR